MVIRKGNIPILMTVILRACLCSDAQRGDADSDACIPPHIFSGKTAALLLHIRQHRVAPHKISSAKQVQAVICKPLAHAARGRVYHL